MNYFYGVVVGLLLCAMIRIIERRIARRQLKVARNILSDNDILNILLSLGISKVSGSMPTQTTFDNALARVDGINLRLARHYYFKEAIVIQQRAIRLKWEINKYKSDFENHAGSNDKAVSDL